MNLKEAGLYNRIRTIDSPQGAWLVVDGKRVLNFCSNNYLGLANHPRLVQAAQQAAGKSGVGPAAVRSIAGTMDLHLELAAHLGALDRRIAHRDQALHQVGHAAVIGPERLVPGARRIGEKDFAVRIDLDGTVAFGVLLLAAWPTGIPLALEAQDPSWQVDETHERLRAAGAVLVVTETDEAPDPPLTVTGPFLYLRLRRTMYGTADLDAWAARLEPFLADGRDTYVFFRHDEHGTTPGYAVALAERLARYAPTDAAGRGGAE